MPGSFPWGCLDVTQRRSGREAQAGLVADEGSAWEGESQGTDHVKQQQLPSCAYYLSPLGGPASTY